MIQRPRGTRDLLPPESRLWQAVEQTARAVFGAFGADEVRTPAFEPTELFVRSVGETTDIVHKEMYTFEDRKGRSLTLRPEGTAGVARAWIENRLHDRSHPLRLYYIGPMFRYERMQAGRYRQFSQIGLELLGADSPLADAELLLVLHELFTRLGFDDLQVHLNNLGDPEDRPRYQQLVRETLAASREALCSDCQRRLDENPLRVLDCKVPSCQVIVADVPPVSTVASEASRAHVVAVEDQLDRLGVPFVRNPRLVRGLDYYLRTVFEVVSPKLGTNAVLCGGGRYDRLISDLGGPAVPGSGFAIGEDRLVDLLPDGFKVRVLGLRRLYLVPLGGAARAEALRLARDWTRAGVVLEVELTGRSLKAALKRADKEGFAAVAILGDDELAAGTVAIRELATSSQEVMSPAEVPAWWAGRS
ncbi:MAG: histidine--tRNA ligase [Thermoanaerobaculaceae bacterium]|nr:histidine--tRNA ligase [Thermoanaerobaculaceae bacterium]MDI9623083.1 histidine--tRNA ligase [Acidobacteriota bacterium]NLH11374.1 histidine--tRNA ligase [Holophagae bacterium]